VALEKKVETRNMVLTTVEERRLEHQWRRLEQRLTHYPEPIVAVTLTPLPARRLVQVDLRVRLGPAGAQLISHQAADTADHAVALAVDDALRQQERHRARLQHEASYGVPSRREAREHRRPVRAQGAGDEVPSHASAGPEAAGGADGRDVSITIDQPAPHAQALFRRSSA
jgi:hypothetical protein